MPSRRTRDPDDVDISWTLGPYRFELPLLASAMDGVVSVGPERPRDVHVIGVAGAPRGHDGDVVESIGAARLLASADLNFHDGILGLVADESSAHHATSGIM